ncbi:hypothetical protein CJP74_04060 [Psittacicella melopsittaci]|uniref:(Na+)-NQR maturation NqrM n=1 Tax=Psittacicella melopsittaci TaxID=2028576 RepID=A0A3A1Y982_9GAMM|nr:(Na+)-NQR maturation NqrM [Psittacicella melopsittaci]RIY32667.1 hypothetical protein CJP74_04060 [Psittacicella melopsittaci]
MLATFVLTLVILLVVVAGASIGVMFKRKPIKGSCGGLDALGIAKACSCKEPCSTAREELARKAYKNDPERREQVRQQAQTQADSDYASDRTGEGVFKAK